VPPTLDLAFLVDRPLQRFRHDGAVPVMEPAQRAAGVLLRLA
jgi:hypothetical protein